MATPLTVGIPPLVTGQKIEEWEPLFRAAVSSLVATTSEKAAIQLLPAYLSRLVVERTLALEAIKRDTLDDAFKLLKDNLDPPDDIYEATRRYYSMEWSCGEFVDDFWVRVLREAKRAKHSARQAAVSLITQLPVEIQAPCKVWIADKEELSDQNTREFMIKVKLLLVQRGIPTDRGWRKTDVLQVTSGTPEEKQGATTVSPNDSDEEDGWGKVHVVRGTSRGVRGSRRGRYPTRGIGKTRLECFACGKPGHWERQCPERKCHRCGVAGHYASECWDERESVRWPRGQKGASKNRVLRVSGTK